MVGESVVKSVFAIKQQMTNMKKLLCVGLLCLCVAGCEKNPATKPISQPIAPILTADTFGDIGGHWGRLLTFDIWFLILQKNLEKTRK